MNGRSHHYTACLQHSTGTVILRNTWVFAVQFLVFLPPCNLQLTQNIIYTIFTKASLFMQDFISICPYRFRGVSLLPEAVCCCLQPHCTNLYSMRHGKVSIPFCCCSRSVHYCIRLRLRYFTVLPCIPVFTTSNSNWSAAAILTRRMPRRSVCL